MQIAQQSIGTVVSTQKHRKFEGAKLLLVQPLNLDDTPRGAALLAVDGVGAGVHEKVLVVLEGRAAGEALGQKAAPVDAAIVGIIDTVTVCMNDQELREMIRESIARHAGAAIAPRRARAAARPLRCARQPRVLPLVRSGDDDGACLIEPSVRCNHCGYCLSYGH